MNEEPNIIPPGEPEKSVFLGLALLVAFLPSLIFLVLLKKVLNHPIPSLVPILCVVTVICCFASSFLLLPRRPILATFVALLFLVLNVVVSVFIGCSNTRI